MAKAKLRRRGHIRQRGKSWVVTFRLNGRQRWSSFKSREAAELYLAEWQPKLIRQEEVEQAPVRVTFGEAALEWLRHAEHERAVKPSTLRDYRSALEAHFIGTEEEPGWLRGVPLERISARTIEEWRSNALRRGMSRRSASKLVAILHGVFERARRAYRFPSNPIDDVERLKVAYSGRFDFYSPEEVWALVRAAKDELDGVIFLVAAFTGLRRGELLALRWRDVDFLGEAIRVVENLAGGELGTPKSGKVRSVPMVPDVAAALARLGQRERFIGPDDFVFVGESGGPLDGSALRRRYMKATADAGLRSLRFHDLRHTFGSLAARRAESTRELQEWMGHADPKTTARYTHYRSRGGEAARLSGAFQVQAPLQANGFHESDRAFRAEASQEDGTAAGIGVSAEAGGTGETP